MTVAVTGGAGYIGAHVVRALLDADQDVVVIDDLSTGSRSVVPPDVPLEVCSVSDVASVTSVFRRRNVRGAIHLAAKKSVEESEEDPCLYFDENVGGMSALLAACHDTDVEWVLFSSTAAVYGTPQRTPVDESAPTRPESAYGESKLACEWLLRRAGRAYGIRWAILRYFNVVGAGEPALGDRGTSNLFPRLVDAAERGLTPEIFGTNHPTDDGTCVRDYVDARDVAKAHVAVAQALDRGRGGMTYNVGTGHGVSVRQVVGEFARATGVLRQPKLRGPRRGDPATVVADPSLIAAELGWVSHIPVAESVRSAWDARTSPPPEAAKSQPASAEE